MLGIKTRWTDLSVEEAIRLMPDDPTIPSEERISREKAAEILKKKGYSLFQEQVEKDKPVADLLKLLQSAGIKIFSSSDVKKYQAIKQTKKNLLSHTIGVVVLVLFCIGILALSSWLIAWFAHWLGAGTWTQPLAFCGGPIGLLSSFLWFVLFSVFSLRSMPDSDIEYDREKKEEMLGKWTWDSSPLGRYEQPIPEAILERISVIVEVAKKKELPILFSIEELVFSDKEIDSDPFIYVHIKGDDRKFYFGVWNEPGFKSKCYLP